MAKRGRSLLEVTGLVAPGDVKKFMEGGVLSDPVVKKELNRIGNKPEKKKEEKADKSHDKFVAKMFKMRDIAHLLHLKTTSYAEHKALDEFYKGLLPFIDSVAEMAQAKGLLDIRIPAIILDTTAVDYISSFRREVKEFKGGCDCDGINNVLDEIMGLCSITLYKLKFLT